MDGKNKIWNYSIPEIMDGYAENGDEYQCIFCGKTFTKGCIYSFDDNLYDAFGAVKIHVRSSHGCTASYLLNQEPALLGISALQCQILNYMWEGKSDQEISTALDITPSTVRNHRFKLREREKQAKLFLAMMGTLESKTNQRIEQTDNGTLEEIHASAAMVDERFNITADERQKVLDTYMEKNGGLKQFPARAKKKIIILQEIVKNFKTDEEYTEQEVNRVLKRIFEEDYPSIRRSLIEYGFMDRSRDGSCYRVKE